MEKSCEQSEAARYVCYYLKTRITKIKNSKRKKWGSTTYIKTMNTV